MAKLVSGSTSSFVAGFAAGALSALLVEAIRPRRGFDPRLAGPRDEGAPPTVIVPGILGSQLYDPSGREVWLNLGNMVGAHDVGLPPRVPLSESRDELAPRGLLGVDRSLPLLFGFSEYRDLADLLEQAGFQRDRSSGLAYHVFAYDWRRDLVESARALGAFLESLAESRGDPELKVNLIGHSMGGVVARYYLRYGGAEPGGPVTWEGARRVSTLVCSTAPSGGSLPALEALLQGSRVGFSTTTLAASVVTTFPSLYALLPSVGSRSLIDPNGAPVDLDLFEPGTWSERGWGPFADPAELGDNHVEQRRAFFLEALARGRSVRDALERAPRTECPCRVVLVGGDTLPTLARAVLDAHPGARPRFEPRNRREAAWMFEAGDGRVPRASLLASHLASASDEEACGVPEASRIVFGHGDHHGLYSEPAFQSALLRLLLKPARPLLDKQA